MIVSQFGKFSATIPTQLHYCFTTYHYILVTFVGSALSTVAMPGNMPGNLLQN